MHAAFPLMCGGLLLQKTWYESKGQLFTTTMWPTVMQLVSCGQLVFSTSANTLHSGMPLSVASSVGWGLDHCGSWLIKKSIN